MYGMYLCKYVRGCMDVCGCMCVDGCVYGEVCKNVCLGVYDGYFTVVEFNRL